MKQNLLAVTALLLFNLTLFAQVPQAFKYQTVVRAEDGNILTGKEVQIKISILQNSPVGQSIYSETFKKKTNDFGLVNLEIGNGTAVAGIFTDINWSAGPLFIEVASKLNEGADFNIMGTSQLMSVPYALHAQTAANTFSGNYTDLSGKPDLSAFITNPDDADADPLNEIQVLSIRNDTIFLSNGGFVKLPEDKVEDADADPANEKIRNVELNGTVLEINEGGDIITIDLLPVFEGAFNTGFTNGEALGYNEGYGAGHAEGLSSGTSDGYSDGYKAGILVNYNVGFNDGFYAGYAEGDAVGYQAGFDKGNSDGYSDGYEIGTGN